jgi:hypothetical protein
MSRNSWAKIETAITTIRMLIAMPILFQLTRSRMAREMTLVTFAMDYGR